MKSEEKPDFEAGLYDSSRNVADQAVAAVGNNPERFRTVLDLCFKEKYPMSMRAARVVQLCAEKNLQLILPYLNEISEKIVITKIEGVKRNFLKIFTEFIDFELLKDDGRLADACFKWLSDSKETVVVRYYCMNYCYNLCKYYPELKHELSAVLEQILPEETSGGMRKRAKEILQKLEQNNFF